MNLRPPLVRRRPLRSVLAFFVTAPISLWSLVRLVRARRIDVVNVHYPDLNFVHFIALRWLTRVRLVTSVHGGDLTALHRGSLARWLMSQLLARSDVIVAPSQEYCGLRAIGIPVERSARDRDPDAPDQRRRAAAAPRPRCRGARRVVVRLERLGVALRRHGVQGASRSLRPQTAHHAVGACSSPSLSASFT
jgi:hypothetical protein